MKIKKYNWILNKGDFKFLDNFCEEHRVKEGYGNTILLGYLLNEYKLLRRKRRKEI
jgi:hypothetical protein